MVGESRKDLLYLCLVDRVLAGFRQARAKEVVLQGIVGLIGLLLARLLPVSDFLPLLGIDGRMFGHRIFGFGRDGRLGLVGHGVQSRRIARGRRLGRRGDLAEIGGLSCSVTTKTREGKCGQSLEGFLFALMTRGHVTP